MATQLQLPRGSLVFDGKVGTNNPQQNGVAAASIIGVLILLYFKNFQRQISFAYGRLCIALKHVPLQEESI